MDYLISGDLHGSPTAARQLLDIFKREQPQCLLLLGDYLLGARDSEERIRTAELLNSKKECIRAVRGNCDSDALLDWLDFTVEEERLLLREQGRLIFATHGHLWDESMPPQMLQPGDILLTGHSHVPCCRKHRRFIYINPGSLARPRNNSQPSCLLYREGSFTWLDAAGQRISSFAWGAEQ